MPKLYLITLGTAMVPLSTALAVHQAQKSRAVFAQKFKLSSLTDESSGKEGQEYFQMVLMKRDIPGRQASTLLPIQLLLRL